MSWNPLWDQIIEKALPPEVLSSQAPRGVRLFCPRFYEMDNIDKRTFWAYFFQVLVGAEAGLNPNTRRPSHRTGTHHGHAQRRLAAACVRRREAIRLRFQLGSGSPWSALRPDEPSYLVFAKQMTNPPSSMWTAHKVEDRQVGYDEVGAGRREPR
jgi:hypothetical protein